MRCAGALEVGKGGRVRAKGVKRRERERERVGRRDSRDGGALAERSGE